MKKSLRAAILATIASTLTVAASLRAQEPTPPVGWDFDPAAISDAFNFLHEYVTLESGVSTRLDRWEASPAIDQKIKLATLSIKSFKMDFGVVHSDEFDATDKITDQFGVGLTFFWHRQPPKVAALAPDVNVPILSSALKEMALHVNVVTETTGLFQGQFSSGRARLQLGASVRF